MLTAVWSDGQTSPPRPVHGWGGGEQPGPDAAPSVSAAGSNRAAHFGAFTKMKSSVRSPGPWGP